MRFFPTKQLHKHRQRGPSAFRPSKLNVSLTKKRDFDTTAKSLTFLSGNYNVVSLGGSAMYATVDFDEDVGEYGNTVTIKGNANKKRRVMTHIKNLGSTCASLPSSSGTKPDAAPSKPGKGCKRKKSTMTDKTTLKSIKNYGADPAMHILTQRSVEMRESYHSRRGSEEDRALRRFWGADAPGDAEFDFGGANMQLHDWGLLDGTPPATRGGSRADDKKGEDDITPVDGRTSCGASEGTGARNSEDHILRSASDLQSRKASSTPTTSSITFVAGQPGSLPSGRRSSEISTQIAVQSAAASAYSRDRRPSQFENPLRQNPRTPTPDQDRYRRWTENGEARDGNPAVSSSPRSPIPTSRYCATLPSEQPRNDPLPLDAPAAAPTSGPQRPEAARLRPLSRFAFDDAPAAAEQTGSPDRESHWPFPAQAFDTALLPVERASQAEETRLRASTQPRWTADPRRSSSVYGD